MIFDTTVVPLLSRWWKPDKKAGSSRGRLSRLGPGFSPATFFQFSLNTRADRGRGYQADSTIEIRFVFTGFYEFEKLGLPVPAQTLGYACTDGQGLYFSER